MPVGKCPMCLLEKQLVKSHLIPRAVYDLLREPDEDPILFTKEAVRHTSRQTKDYLLCTECEDVLNSEGERWVLPLLAREEGDFAIHDLLTSHKPYVGDDTISAFLTAKNPDFMTEKLAHFGLGIFWKASVHSWTKEKRGSRIDLGPYQDPLRRYLRKECDFPKEMALVVVVAPRPVNFVSLELPYRTSERECHRFMFYVPGIQFSLYVGKTIPHSLRKCCMVSSPGNPVLLCDLSESVIRMAREVFANAHVAKRVLDRRKKRKNEDG